MRDPCRLVGLPQPQQGMPTGAQHPPRLERSVGILQEVEPRGIAERLLRRPADHLTPPRGKMGHCARIVTVPDPSVDVRPEPRLALCPRD